MCLGIPACVLEVVDRAGGLARVDVSGVRREVSVALVDTPGDALPGAGPEVLFLRAPEHEVFSANGVAHQPCDTGVETSDRSPDGQNR